MKIGGQRLVMNVGVGVGSVIFGLIVSGEVGGGVEGGVAAVRKQGSVEVQICVGDL